MTDPLLNYQTPAPAPTSALRTATWIYLLILGILYGLGGLCAGGSMAFAFAMMTRVVPGGPPRGVGTIFLIIGIVMLLICLGIGAAFIWSALRLRRGSQAAAITALVLSILTTTGFLAIVALGTFAILSQRPHDPAAVLGLLAYLLPAAVNAAAIFLLIALLRNPPRRLPSYDSLIPWRCPMPERPPIPYTSPLPFVHERVGAAAIYCSDGRYGEAMDEFLHDCLGLPHYDRVAIPGGAACLAGHMLALRERSALDRQLKFLVESHGLDRVVLIAHQDCGFYKHNVHPSKLRQKPLEEMQYADLATVAATLRDFHRDLEVDAYFARRVNDQVRFDPIAT